MSFFGVSLSSLAQTIEAVGNMVAPLPDEMDDFERELISEGTTEETDEHQGNLLNERNKSLSEGSRYTADEEPSNNYFSVNLWNQLTPVANHSSFLESDSMDEISLDKSPDFTGNRISLQTDLDHELIQDVSYPRDSEEIFPMGPVLSEVNLSDDEDIEVNTTMISGGSHSLSSSQHMTPSRLTSMCEDETTFVLKCQLQEKELERLLLEVSFFRDENYQLKEALQAMEARSTTEDQVSDGDDTISLLAQQLLSTRMDLESERTLSSTLTHNYNLCQHLLQSKSSENASLTDQLAVSYNLLESKDKEIEVLRENLRQQSESFLASTEALKHSNEQLMTSMASLLHEQELSRNDMKTEATLIEGGQIKESNGSPDLSRAIPEELFVLKENQEENQELEELSRQVSSLQQEFSQISNLVLGTCQTDGTSKAYSENSAAIQAEIVLLIAASSEANALAERLREDCLQLEATIQSRDEALKSIANNNSQVEDQQQNLAAAVQQIEATKLEHLRLEETSANYLLQIQQLRAQVESLIQTRDQTSMDSKEQIAALEKQNMKAKADLQKIEIENRQLHEVIKQLRQVRRISKEDVDQVVAEKDALKILVDSQSLELARLSHLLSSQSQNNERVNAQEKELVELRARYAEIEAQLIQERFNLVAVEKLNYDKEIQSDVMKSDILLLKQDLDQRSVELNNLYNALNQVQHDSDVNKQRLQEDFEQKVRRFQEICALDIKDKENKWNEDSKSLNAQIKQLEVQRQDEALLKRKAEIDLAQEKKRMQETLSDAIDRLNNSQQDVVDRTLISNLVVSYFQRKRSLDVLGLIARILMFSEEQKVAVGLKPPPYDNIVKNLFTTLVGSAPKVVEVEGDNLAELWINFLLVETENIEEKNKSKLKQRQQDPAVPVQVTDATGLSSP